MVGRVNKLVCGWGINDVEYHICKFKGVKEGSKSKWTCPYYSDWREMIKRCFDTKFQAKKPTYKGCTVCEEWKYFSNFIRWVDSQPNKDWQNCCLDKDFLVAGNKHYSPETCVYIPISLNSFTTDSVPRRGSCMIGVCIELRTTKCLYKVQCYNHFLRKQEYLGLFETELEAHLTWKAKKHEHALKLADLQEDERVAKRLREMYSPETDWTNR